MLIPPLSVNLYQTNSFLFSKLTQKFINYSSYYCKGSKTRVASRDYNYVRNGIRILSIKQKKKSWIVIPYNGIMKKNQLNCLN